MNVRTISGQARRLIAIDFDHTIVNGNTDIIARDLVDGSKIPHSVQILHKSYSWTHYMQEIFKILYNNGYKKNDILTAICGIPEIPGMLTCLKSLHSNNFDIIIISDSNSEFIDKWNINNELSKLVSEIFTNPANFDQCGLLHLKPFHSQSECSISSINLCKGRVLDEYLMDKSKNNIIYQNVIYVGDGYHDICPMLRLSATDLACPRLNHAADKYLEKTAEKVSTHVKAQVLRWHDGNDLFEQIQKCFCDITIKN